MAAIQKIAQSHNVEEAARERIRLALQHCERAYISFSGGKDSTVMTHLVMDEAKKLGKRVGILTIDFEAQYAETAKHVQEMMEMYRGQADLYWVCLPIILRNAVTQFEPRWCAWDPAAKSIWVRNKPTGSGVIGDSQVFPWFVDKMEFEEFIVLFHAWYSQGKTTACFVGIRSDESLNRFRTIAVFDKGMLNGWRWTTEVEPGLYNIYPLYDWRTRDIWIYHAKHPEHPHNRIYDMMHFAGLSIHQMRLCQPYGDDQRRGLWLFHLLEPETWAKIVARVSGANSGAIYINENGNMTGYNSISRPDGHTWKSFANLLLSSLPPQTREHYLDRFETFVRGWLKRGYANKGIPDEAPKVLEDDHWAPSWRRICKVLLRNDWWCKGLGLQQPKSKAYEEYMRLVRNRKVT